MKEKTLFIVFEGLSFGEKNKNFIKNSGRNLKYFFKKRGVYSDNPSMRIYINKINYITFKIKAGYYLELLTPTNFIPLKIFNLELLHIEVWFTG